MIVMERWTRTFQARAAVARMSTAHPQMLAKREAVSLEGSGPDPIQTRSEAKGAVKVLFLSLDQELTLEMLLGAYLCILGTVA